ncbi:glycosyltransferase, partial [Raoultella terrigena]|uniref:glycosyltransferase n=1 Tax=Raoultella terrigena TaxID=577 RepID=UPI002F94F3E9
MRVLIYTFGTRGDVQPFLALAQRLVRAGHEAAVCTAAGYRDLVEGAGVDYLHMSNDMLQLIRDSMPQMSGPRDAPRLIRAMSSAQRAALADQWTAAREYQPTTVVYHPKSLGGYHVAEKLGVPGVLSLPLPFFTPTRE